MILVPKIKSYQINNGSYLVPQSIRLNLHSFSYKLVEAFTECFKCDCQISNDLNSDIILLEKELPIQGYTIEIHKKQIIIGASTNQGVYYALKTIKQIIANENIACCKIEDWPDLEIRGLMVDISRSKVPSLNTMKKLVDIMSDLKYNHLELYVEGFSYEYQSFPHFLSKGNFFTLKDFMELEEYANKHYIDLVPNQNGFGHMGDWLLTKEYHHLAECEDGFSIWGSHRASTTLDPTNPKSLQLVTKMYNDMLPHFKSQYFNMNFDEPYELGHGKSRLIYPNKAVEDLFIDFLKSLSEVVRSYKKTPMIWGDVLIKHPDAITKLDKDIIFIDWGYDKLYQFEEHAKKLEQANIKYLMAPGTNTWSTITGRYDNMSKTIQNSCSALKNHQGLGMLLTDWGDIGHLQYLPFSYIGIIYGAICSWGEDDSSLIEPYLSKLITPSLASIMIDLSKYSELEGSYRDYGTRLFAPILWSEKALMDKYVTNKVDFWLNKMSNNLLTKEAYDNLVEYFKLIQQRLYLIQSFESSEDYLIYQEVQNSLLLLQTLLTINAKITNLQKNYHLNYFSDDIEQLKQYQKIHYSLWLKRNNPAGYNDSNSRISWLIDILRHIDEKEKV